MYKWWTRWKSDRWLTYGPGWGRPQQRWPSDRPIFQLTLSQLTLSFSNSLATTSWENLSACCLLMTCCLLMAFWTRVREYECPSEARGLIPIPWLFESYPISRHKLTIYSKVHQKSRNDSLFIYLLWQYDEFVSEGLTYLPFFFTIFLFLLRLFF